MYFLYSAGRRHGPYTTGQIQEMQARGTMAPDTAYWHGRTAQWRPLPELLHYLSSLNRIQPRLPAPPISISDPPRSSNTGIVLAVLGFGAVCLLLLLAIGLILPSSGRGSASGSFSSSPGQTESATAVAAQTLPSTAIIKTDKALGSGFLVAPNTVVTNFHVIDGAEEATVRFSSGANSYRVIQALKIDTVNDLALLQIDAPGRQPLSLEGDSYPDVGAEIYVIGSPEGLANTFSKGNISQIRVGPKGSDWLQFTAPISHGSSGGPVLSSSGKVIGVCVATWTDGQNLNFAIPVRYVRKLLQSMSTEN